MNIQFKAKNLAKKIYELIEVNAFNSDSFKAVHSPIDFGDNAMQYISDCLASTWVSTSGNYVNQFALKLSEYIGSKYVVPVSSGTAALKLALIAMNVNKGDEVIVPSFTFVASANSVSHIGGVPHFVDIESKTLGIDPVKLEKYLSKKVVFKNNKTINRDTGANISALIAVHVYGNSCNILEISRICKKFNIKLLEDCAGALGTFTKTNKGLCHVGRLGEAGCLSFNGNKIITTGGGGAVFTESETIYSKLLHLSTTARVNHPFEIEHNDIGWNDRMPNLNASLGLSQMEMFKKNLANKEKIYSMYKSNFFNNEDYKFLEHNQYCKSNLWLNSILIKNNENLDQFKSILYEELISKKIQIRAGWKPINLLKMYRLNPSDNCKESINLASKIINLPSNFLIK